MVIALPPKLVKIELKTFGAAYSRMVRPRLPAVLVPAPMKVAL
jgi:hypothetical protein